ncbi:hypothetical protein ABZ615_10740 [Streptomyces sp. NPDC007325]|uniref:hypothetical protein n=1 Tax=unclassified Streptomyces TaxID=2593676 RepID=UPI00340E4F5E
MVQVTVTSAVKVADGGPVLAMTRDEEARAYTMSFSKLEKTGAAGGKDQDVIPLPDGEIVLLALTVVNANGAVATADVTFKGSTALTVKGSLLVTSQGAVAKVIPPGENRTVTLKNNGSEPVWVEILTCRGVPTA